MKNTGDALLDFVREHIKNRDLMLRRIERLEENADGFYVKYKHRESQFISEPNLSESTFKRIGKFKSVAVICLNTKENLEFLIRNWKDFSANPHLSLYFVNQKSHTEKVWIIFPHTHAKVADDESLRLGLETMFGNVEEAQTEGFNKERRG